MFVLLIELKVLSIYFYLVGLFIDEEMEFEKNFVWMVEWNVKVFG